MITKSYEIEKNISKFIKYNMFLLYGENYGLKKEIQELYDFIFKQLELSIREIGYGDMSINKKMKTYISTFHYLLKKIDLWEKLNDNKKDEFDNNFFSLENISNDKAPAW